MTAADKKIKHPYTFCSKSVGMLLLFYAIMMLRNTAFAASETVTTLPSGSPVLAATSPYRGDIKQLQNYKVDNSLYMFCG